MKLTIKYGLLVGLGSFAWVLAEYFLGFRTTHFGTHLVTSLFAVVVLILGIVGALHERQAQLGKAFRFKSGLLTGLGVSLIAGIIMVCSMYLYFGVIDHDYPNRAKAWNTYVLVLDGTPLETAKASTAAGAWKHNMHVQALGQIPLFVVRGGLIAVIVSGIMVRRRRQV